MTVQSLVGRLLLSSCCLILLQACNKADEPSSEEASISGTRGAADPNSSKYGYYFILACDQSSTSSQALFKDASKLTLTEFFKIVDKKTFESSIKKLQLGKNIIASSPFCNVTKDGTLSTTLTPVARKIWTCSDTPNGPSVYLDMDLVASDMRSAKLLKFEIRDQNFKPSNSLPKCAGKGFDALLVNRTDTTQVPDKPGDTPL